MTEPRNTNPRQRPSPSPYQPQPQQQVIGVDLAHRVQDYAYKVMSDDIRVEYEDQISKWAIHINTLIKYAKNAYELHHKHLTDIKNAQKANNQFALLALSLLAGPALSFVAAKIQYNLVPALFGKPGKSSSYAKKEGNDGWYTRYDIIDPLAHDKVTGKVWGDFVASLSQATLVNPAIQAAATPDGDLKGKISVAGDSMTLEDFETNIKNALEEAKRFGAKGINNYAKVIRDDPGYGDRWLKQGENAQLLHASMGGYIPDESIDARLEWTKQKIRLAFDEQRRAWAKNKDWFYFGHDPAPLGQQRTINAIEAEIWALWIASEDFEFVNVGRNRGYEIEDDYGSSRIWAKGKSGIELDLILDRLIAIGVVQGRNTSEFDKWLEKDSEARRERKDSGWLPAELGGIHQIVDTEAELKKVLNWVKTRKPQLLGDHRPAVPRSITPLVPGNVKS